MASLLRLAAASIPIMHHIITQEFEQLSGGGIKQVGAGAGAMQAHCHAEMEIEEGCWTARKNKLCQFWDNFCEPETDMVEMCRTGGESVVWLLPG